MGAIPIRSLTPPMVVNVFQPLAKQGKLETVRRLCQNVNQIATYAVNTGLLLSNSLTGVGRAFAVPEDRQMATIKPDRLPEFMLAMSKSDFYIGARCLLLWQLHTAVRPNEAAATRWDEIDTVNALWTIPALRMKRKREHVVPLTSQALSILESIKPINSHYEHVFPQQRTPSNSAHAQTVNGIIKRHIKFDGLVSHEFRSIFSTAANDAGHPPHVIEVCLAHAEGSQS